MNNGETCHIIKPLIVEKLREFLRLDDETLRQHTYQNFSAAEIRSRFQYQMIHESPGSELASCRTYHAIMLLVPPIILLVGSVGNFLSFSVLCSRAMIQISSYVYLAVLAVADEGILLLGLLSKWISYLRGIETEDSSSAVCKTLLFTSTTVSYISVWLIVMVTLERFIVIAFPFKATRLTTPYRAKLIIAVICSLALMFSLHFFETVDLVEKKTESRNITKCDFKPEYSSFHAAWTWIDAVLFSYLPFLLIACLNIIIAHGIIKAHHTRSRMMYCGPIATDTSETAAQGSTSHRSSSSKRGNASNRSSSRQGRTTDHRQLNIMLLVVSLMFFGTTVPIAIMKIVIKSISVEETAEIAWIQLADAVCEMVMYCNHAVNFLLYCALGKKFRQQMLQMCSLCGRQRAPRESMGDTSDDRRKRRTELVEMKSLVDKPENGANVGT